MWLATRVLNTGSQALLAIVSSPSDVLHPDSPSSDSALFSLWLAAVRCLEVLLQQLRRSLQQYLDVSLRAPPPLATRLTNPEAVSQTAGQDDESYPPPLSLDPDTDVTGLGVQPWSLSEFAHVLFVKCTPLLRSPRKAVHLLPLLHASVGMLFPTCRYVSGCATAASELYNAHRPDQNPAQNGPTQAQQQLAEYLRSLSDVIYFLREEPSLGWMCGATAGAPDSEPSVLADEAVVSLLGTVELCLALSAAACHGSGTATYQVRRGVRTVGSVVLADSHPAQSCCAQRPPSLLKRLGELAMNPVLYLLHPGLRQRLLEDVSVAQPSLWKVSKSVVVGSTVPIAPLTCASSRTTRRPCR